MWTLAGFTDYAVALLPGILDVDPDDSVIASDGFRVQFHAGDIQDLVMETEAWLHSH